MANLDNGARAGRFVIVAHLGTGGMAEVYLARPAEGDPEVRVALKRLRPHLAAQPGFSRMFVREGRLAASLVHPHVLGLLGVEEHDGETFLVMPYVRGKDLALILAALGRLALGPALRIVVDVGAALDHAHRLCDDAGKPRHIVHRDVSPANVLVSYAGEVKLADFGLARVAEQTVRTAPGMLKGKFGYMAPEQYLEEPVDARSDVFALGVILYEMTTGQRAFHADRGPEIVNRVLEGRYLLPHRIDPDYPPELEGIVVKALEVEADARFSSAAEMVEAVQRYAMGAGLDLRRSTLATLMTATFVDRAPVASAAGEAGDAPPRAPHPTPVETKQPESGSADEIERWAAARRRRTVTIAAIGIVVATIVGVGLAALR